MVPLAERLAGAPISWGVCEVPGWGEMLPPLRVLSEMRGLGLRATELGPVGYLGPDPECIRRTIEDQGLETVGGFVPLVLHDRLAWPSARIQAERACRLIAGAGGRYFVTAVVADEVWSRPPELGEEGWAALSAGLAEVDELCAAHGLAQVLHPHAGTLVQTAADIDRVAEVSEVRWCLDTGHLAIGGVDPKEFAGRHAGRIGLVHLKDVHLPLAEPVRTGAMSLREASSKGLFRPLGQGDLPVADIMSDLESSGYTGWYVLEQDTVIEPATGADRARPDEEVRASIEYLHRHFGSPAIGPGRRG